MKRNETNKYGFTLIELVIVISILAVLAAILVPTVIGFIHKSQAAVCDSDMNTIIRTYEYRFAMEYAKDTSVTPEEVLALDIADEFPDATLSGNVIESVCPAGGTYTCTFDENHRLTIVCSVHGGSTEPSAEPSAEPSPEPSGSGGGTLENTEYYFYVGGDEQYKVISMGNVKDDIFGSGTVLPDGTVLYYKGEYYCTRYMQYWTSTSKIALINNKQYSIPIDTSGFVTPGPSTQAGQMKLENGNAYVFYPNTTRYYEDYYDSNRWILVTME